MLFALPFDSEAPTIYLNLPGLIRKGQLVSLLDFAFVLAQMLEPYPAVQLVLTSVWLHWLSIEEINRLLPRVVLRRVVTCAYAVSPCHREVRGGTSDPRSVIEHAQRNRIVNWIALHDGAFEVPNDFQHNFVCMRKGEALTSANAQNLVKAWLAKHAKQ